MTIQTKQQIQQALQRFSQGGLKENGLPLLATLGYKSDRQLDLDNSPHAFLEAYDPADTLRERDKALLADWQTIDVLCQITDNEIRQSSQMILLDSAGKVVDNAIIESYLFLAIGLRGEQYTRTQLAHITREVNRLFQMPAMLLFRHGPTLTLSIINRRLHKRDRDKDVLEKVTLIKDIRIANPHRAHLEILFDLSLDELHRQHGFGNFVELHKAWQKTLDSSELNKRFFKEIADWYFWAVDNVTFPEDAGPEETRNATSVIRLITRLIFVWFLKEKGLVPDDLFNKRQLDDLLTWDDLQDSTYYKAILQNLFFATLNQEMNTDAKSDNRKFRGLRESGQSQHFMIHNLYRYERYFRDPAAALALFAHIPFLNGGLFECLDRRVDGQDVRVDGFSDRADNPLRVPDELFFGDERAIDLNATYGTSGKRYMVRPLIETLNRYKFTITENTPIEEEIALDPELLGKVFENLLAAYNPETGTTARKQTGSFYTPREIVNYMVDESLLAYLQTKLAENPKSLGDHSGFEERLRHLFAYNEEPHRFDAAETESLIAAIDQVKILDPACGSGAFPMGILHKLVFILGKLDPHNTQWKGRQIEPLRAAIRAATAIPDSKIRNQTVQELEQQIAEIEQAFARNELDYGRKLYLIENCIYGVDIQPIAVQIAKLRFFISLVVDQRLADAAANRGILPLPNLETKFVAANTLLGIEKPKQMALRNPAITEKERELAEVRSKHFRARTPRTKEKWRAEDKRLRLEISDLLQQEGNLRNEDVRRLAGWNPYDQNASADFFVAEWMFGLEAGFDVAIGNPPYVRQEKIKELKPLLQRQYTCYTGVADLYVYFFESAINLLKPKGVLTFISSNKYFRAGYGEKLRRFLGQKTTIRLLIDFGDAPVFTAIAYPSIITTCKGEPDSNETRVLSWEPGPAIEQFAEIFSANSFLMQQSALTADGWQLEGGAVLQLLDKLRQAGKPLGEYIEGNFYRGVVTGFNEAFGINKKTRDSLISEDPKSAEIIFPWLRGRNVKRWNVSFQGEYLIFTRRGIDIAKYTAIKKHLSQFREQLEPKPQNWPANKKWLGRKPGPYKWYEIQDSTAYFPEFKKPKIISTDIAKRCEFTIDTSESFIDATLFCMPINDLYLLGILNSTLVEFFYNMISSTIRGDYLRFKKIYLYQIPVPTTPSSKIRETIESLVNDLLKTKGEGDNVPKLEREIDELVYALYGLTPAEIALVEGREIDEQVTVTPKVTATTTMATAAAPPLIFTGQPPQGSFPERLKRVQALTKQASPAAIQELVAALADENPTIVWTASAGLRQIGGPQVIGVLQAFIAQTNNHAAKEEAEKMLNSI